MSGWGIFRRIGLHRDDRRTAECVVAAINARNYAALDHLVTEDMVYLDAMSNVLSGRPAFVSAIMQLHKAAPDLTIAIEDISAQGSTVLIRGRLISADPEFCRPSLWQTKYARGLLNEVQTYREHNAISLPLLAERAEG